MYKDFVYISPKYQVRHYTELNLNLESDRYTWNIAIDIVKDRLENRFLLIIQDMLDKVRKQIGSIDYSFSIMALNCLFIEALRQFKLGHDETKGANQKAFVKFFKSSDHFINHLTTDEAEIFYKHIRCGILHQAQTQFNSQLTIDQPSMIQRLGDDCIRVDIEKFTYALIADFEGYLKDLSQVDKVDLRTNLVKKMNFIVEKISHSE